MALQLRTVPSSVLRRAATLLGCLVLVGLLSPGWAWAGDKCKHTVRSGETLEQIAADHGIDPKDLIETNRALRKNPDLIRVGQTLDVCAAKRKHRRKKRARKRSRHGRSCGGGGVIAVHTVETGDSVGKIAARYGVNERAILRRNKELRDDPDLLRVGQKLEICTGRTRVRGSKMCGYRSPVYVHRVVPGEHLGGIAGRYGVRRRDLMRWNPSLRKRPDMLRVGQRLKVCPQIAPRERKRITHTVRSGQNLGTIAEKYGLSPNELERYQQGRLDHRDALRPGQELIVWVDGDIVRGFAERSDDSGSLRGGIQLPPGRHYEIKWRRAAWGTASTVRNIQRAISTYKRRAPGGPKVFIGDISKRSGGRFPPHISHQKGRDVDVGYIHEGPYKGRFRRGHLDVPRTWALVKAFIDTNQVQKIFMGLRVQKKLYRYARSRGISENLLDELFQYPRRRRHGIIQHWRGHRDHFHVRFRR